MNTNLFGELEMPVATSAERANLAARFGVPPFSVLDARQGYWQDRKRAWLALGIQSEIGRGGRPHGGKDDRPIGPAGIAPLQDFAGGDCWRGTGNCVAGGRGWIALRGSRMKPRLRRQQLFKNQNPTNEIFLKSECLREQRS
jgi:hypothetical protein